MPSNVHPIPPLLSATTFVNHLRPFFSCAFLVCFLGGLPPSFPHSRIFLMNSFFPHFFFRAWALRLPKMLAALLTSFAFLGILWYSYKPNVRLFQPIVRWSVP